MSIKHKTSVHHMKRLASQTRKVCCNIAMISILATMLAGCYPECKTDEQGRPVVIQAKTDSAVEKNSYYFEFNNLPVTLKYVMFDGHEYVVARCDRGFGITHSPKCECKK